MDRIDRSDKCCERGSGFVAKADYKKWYKKAYFAIHDFRFSSPIFLGTFLWMRCKED